MKIGANSFIWREHFGLSDVGLFDTMARRGLDGIEFGILDPRSFRAREMRDAVQHAGLSCTTCCVIPSGASLLSSDADCRKRAREHIRVCLKVSAELGADLLCGPLYSPVGEFSRVRRTADEWKNAVESWQELALTAHELGIEVALEALNRYETYFLNTIGDAAAFAFEVNHSSVGVLVDTYHANIEEKSIAAALKTAGPFLKHVHSSECDRGTPGTGGVHWDQFFAALREIGYDRWLVIESFGFSAGELSAAASIWRDLAAKAEDIAYDGAAFLRSRLELDGQSFQI